jgi:UrcA family protein
MRTLLLACAVAAMTAAPALAGEGIRVSTANLDLTNQADVAKLHARIERAAERICHDGERLTLALRRQREACIAETMDKTVRTANVPALSALHAELKQAPARS